ncbi:hypothetical protein BDW74DRAFT_96923 [Aspergillus multicolor]|uniref:NmrA-like family protein n=1 Tax=Aspergillus multicolor TaxID=41759 RepID=UPI003CCCBA3E
MGPRKVIVFGATGAVGSAAARTAHSHDAKVFLALRNTSKPVPGLSATEEQSGRYERVQADLTQPDTVRDAVSESGATHAFVYAAIGASTDHLFSTAEALKSAGIESVVMLSSMSVGGDARATQPNNFIGYAHAQVELTLESVFGRQGYVAVRPTFFANNSLWWSRQIIEDGEVKWAFPEHKFDYISPDDIGAVCGTILAGAYEGVHESPVCLFGPETDLSVADAIEVIGRVINKPVKFTKVGPDEQIQVMVEKSGMPEPFARVLTGQLARDSENKGPGVGEMTPEIKSNVEKYLKRPAMRFSEWVELNKEKFGA